jgi:hypothetical protein
MCPENLNERRLTAFFRPLEPFLRKALSLQNKNQKDVDVKVQVVTKRIDMFFKLLSIVGCR